MHMTLYEAEHWEEIHSSEEKETAEVRNTPDGRLEMK